MPLRKQKSFMSAEFFINDGKVFFSWFFFVFFFWGISVHSAAFFCCYYGKINEM